MPGFGCDMNGGVLLTDSNPSRECPLLQQQHQQQGSSMARPMND
jgi:hypothetical protein